MSPTPPRIRPKNIEELAEAVRSADSVQGLIVTSSGDARSDTAVVVSLESLKSVAANVELGTLTAGGGASMVDVRSALVRAKSEIVGFDGNTRSETVGALIAHGEVPRRGLCGIEAVLSNGDIVRCGGIMQKDVAGYDLISVLLGSLGRLAIIASVTFRIAPQQSNLPAHSPYGENAIAPISGLTKAFDRSGALSRE